MARRACLESGEGPADADDDPGLAEFAHERAHSTLGSARRASRPRIVSATQEQILYAARPGGIGLKKGGTACLVGAVQELGRIDVEELRITQRTYTGTRGSLCRPDRDFPVFVRWFQRGQLDLDALVTQRYTLEKINDATADLAGGRIHGRSIITYT